MGSGGGDSRISQSGSQTEAKYWDTQLANGNLLNGDKAVAKFYGESVDQITPEQAGAYQTYEDQKNQSLFDKWAPAVALAVASAGVAAPVGAAVGAALGGGAAGAVGGGAAAGLTSTAIQEAANGNLSLKGLGTGALGGALGGGLNYGAGNASAALTQNGVNPTLANGLVKAGTGAVGGAVGGALSGQGAGIGALTGAVRGGISAASGAVGSGVGSSTGSSFLGSVAGGVTGYAAGSLFNGSTNNSSSGSTPNGSNYLGAGTTGASGAGTTASAGQGNIGNIGSMASTDSTLAGTITGALPGLLQAGSTAAGSLVAANDKVSADQNAITTQQNGLGNINNIWGTQQALGQGADTALGSALGTNGQPANYSGFENMPGYQFAVNQGTQAIQRQSASLGSAYTPNTSQAIGQYVTGTAMSDYNTYISQLMGAAGLGTTANQGLQTAQQNNVNNVGQLQQNIGNAQASGVTGATSAAAGLFSPNGAGTSLIGAASNYLTGKNGSNGTSGSNAGSNGGIGGGVSNGGISLNNSYLGTGNGTFGSGVDPSTGQPWVNSDATTLPSFDPNSVSMPTMPNIDTGSTDFGGGLDYGSSTDLSGIGTDFLGGF